MPKQNQKTGNDQQGALFIATAKRLGCDESEKRFDQSLRAIAKQKPHPHEPKKPRKKSK